MHSRIFYLYDGPISSAQEYWPDSDDFLNDHPEFFYSAADYVVDTETRTDDMDWLHSHLKESGVKYNPSKETLLIPKGAPQRYFYSAYLDFKKASEKLTLDDFARTSLYDLKRTMEDKHGFYIVYDEMLLTLDAFMRNAPTGIEYQIGTVLDYHF